MTPLSTSLRFSLPLYAACRSAEDSGINHQPLIGVEHVAVPDVVPMEDILIGDTEAGRNAFEGVGADDRINDVLTVVHIGTFRVLLLLPIAVAVVAADAAGDGAEFFFAECHFSSFFFFYYFSYISFYGFIVAQLLSHNCHCCHATTGFSIPSDYPVVRIAPDILHAPGSQRKYFSFTDHPSNTGRGPGNNRNFHLFSPCSGIMNFQKNTEQRFKRTMHRRQPLSTHHR